MHEEHKILRYISVLDKKTEFLVWELQFKKTVSEYKLKEIFNVAQSEEFYGEWQIQKEHLKKIQLLIDEKIDLKKYDYFVSTVRYNPEIRLYKEFRNTKTWKIIEKGLYDLLLNQDISITTKPYYVIGYITSLIEKNSSK